MTMQRDEAIVTAVHIVHDKVWHKHWKEGKTELRPAEAIEYVRQIRTEAGCTEQALPAVLQELVAKAREAQREKKMVRLVELIEPFKQIILPHVPHAA